MSKTPTIHWRPVNVTDLLEARLVSGNGDGDDERGLYVGYIARTPGDGNDEWRGYIGITHVLVAVGTREIVQAAVEQRVRDLLATRAAGSDVDVTRGERGSVDHAS